MKTKVTSVRRPVTGEMLPDDSPLKVLLISGVVAGKLTGVALQTKKWKQYFRIIWAKPEKAKAAALDFVKAEYGASNVSFWRDRNGDEKSFYIEFDWSPEVWRE